MCVEQRHCEDVCAPWFRCSPDSRAQPATHLVVANACQQQGSTNHVLCGINVWAGTSGAVCRSVKISLLQTPVSGAQPRSAPCIVNGEPPSATSRLIWAT
jgi:hypothetical protein